MHCCPDLLRDLLKYLLCKGQCLTHKQLICRSCCPAVPLCRTCCRSSWRASSWPVCPLWSRPAPSLTLHLLQEYLARKQLTGVPIEVETRTLEEVQEVLSLMDHQQHEGVARLMLDNMTRLDSSKPGVTRSWGGLFEIRRGRDWLQWACCSTAAPLCRGCLWQTPGPAWAPSRQVSERWTAGRKLTCSVAAAVCRA